ncbi:ATP synthase F(0) complex subunit k, mitochondrial-like [Tubulanus polymorphus]|uniref:ATP synthase F(0) complex subunit k, mitochondrial-like n=1 Tax=Tubulanus polymorphus TaxID=672921 RepID=UPI003DA576A4
MAGIDESQYKYTGLKYYFNSYTKRGRLNFVLATYGTICAALLYKKMKGKKEIEQK